MDIKRYPRFWRPGHAVTGDRTKTQAEVERFHRARQREWAKGPRYRNSTARNHAPPHWLRHYNMHRPHSSLGGQPPSSRARDLSGQDSQPASSAAITAHVAIAPLIDV